MEGERKFSERIIAHKDALTNLSKKNDQLDDCDGPVIKRKALKKNHDKIISIDGDKVSHNVEKVRNFLFQSPSCKLLPTLNFCLIENSVLYLPCSFQLMARSMKLAPLRPKRSLILQHRRMKWQKDKKTQQKMIF